MSRLLIEHNIFSLMNSDCTNDSSQGILIADAFFFLHHWTKVSKEVPQLTQVVPDGTLVSSKKRKDLNQGDVALHQITLFGGLKKRCGNAHKNTQSCTQTQTQNTHKWRIIDWPSCPGRILKQESRVNIYRARWQKSDIIIQTITSAN